MSSKLLVSNLYVVDPPFRHFAGMKTMSIVMMMT